MKIEIGRSEGKPVHLDLEVLLRTRLLIQANSGGGKSYLLRRLAEQLYGKVQVILIDREGEFSTLREKFGYVLVGKDGDTPADMRSARLLAEKLLELKASAVCDLYEAFRSSPMDRRAWVATFLEALLDAPRSMWRDLVVIVDEAHQFCPQETPKAARAVDREIIARCKDAMVSLATVGRKRGYAAAWATQRLAKLDKDASAELFNRLVGMTIEDVDVDRAVDLMSVSKDDRSDFKKALRNLEPGHFFAFGRALSNDRLLMKAGTVQTTHPEPGAQKQTAEPPPPPEKIRHLLPKLADLPKAAEERQRTITQMTDEIRKLKAEVAGLERRAAAGRPAAAAPSPASAPVKEKVVERLVIDPKMVGRLEDVAEKFARWEAGVGKRVAQVISAPLPDPKDLLLEVLKAVKAAAARPPGPAPAAAARSAMGRRPEAPRTDRPLSAAAPRPAPAVPGADLDTEITKPQRKILETLRFFERLGVYYTPRTWIAPLSDASANSGGFKNNLGSLRSRGFIEYPRDGSVTLTEQGRAEAGEPLDLTPSEVLAKCKAGVTDPQAEILQAVADTFPDSRSREEIAEAVGKSPSSGGFKNNLGALRSAGMIDYPEDGRVILAGWVLKEDLVGAVGR